MTSVKRKNISDAYTLSFPFGFLGKFTFRAGVGDTRISSRCSTRGHMI